MTNKITKLQILGKNFQKYRKQKGLSQNQLAELLEISREHLAKIETGKRGVSLNLLFKFAEVLEVEEAKFFNFN